MAATVHMRARANRDLVEQYVYLAETAGIETAERLLSSAEKSFGDLARHPGMGTPLALRSPRLAGLRKWPVSGFDNLLVFYLPRADGVSIVRVLHGARDWWEVLGVV
jgi:toxin ParE1/3/4